MMRVIDAIKYLKLSVKEGYITEEEAEKLMEMHYPEFVKKMEEMAERGDAQT